MRYIKIGIVLEQLKKYELWVGVIERDASKRLLSCSLTPDLTLKKLEHD